MLHPKAASTESTVEHEISDHQKLVEPPKPKLDRKRELWLYRQIRDLILHDDRPDIEKAKKIYHQLFQETTNCDKYIKQELQKFLTTDINEFKYKKEEGANLLECEMKSMSVSKPLTLVDMADKTKFPYTHVLLLFTSKDVDVSEAIQPITMANQSKKQAKILYSEVTNGPYTPTSAAPTPAGSPLSSPIVRSMPGTRAFAAVNSQDLQTLFTSQNHHGTPLGGSMGNPGFWGINPLTRSRTNSTSSLNLPDLVRSSSSTSSNLSLLALEDNAALHDDHIAVAKPMVCSFDRSAKRHSTSYEDLPMLAQASQSQPEDDQSSQELTQNPFKINSSSSNKMTLQ